MSVAGLAAKPFRAKVTKAEAAQIIEDQKEAQRRKCPIYRMTKLAEKAAEIVGVNPRELYGSSKADDVRQARDAAIRMCLRDGSTARAVAKHFNKSVNTIGAIKKQMKEKNQ